MTESTCTFGEMVPLFQEIFEQDPTRVVALMARMKHLMKLGANAGALLARPGRGKAARHRASDVWELLILMELTDIGITPEKAVGIYIGNPHLAYRADLSGRLPINRRPTSHLFLDADWLLPPARKHLPLIFGARK